MSSLSPQGRRDPDRTVNMKDPSISNAAPNMSAGGEVILSSHFSSEEDPFAEYMWMENEEEFNRQVRRSRAAAHLSCR